MGKTQNFFPLGTSNEAANVNGINYHCIFTSTTFISLTPLNIGRFSYRLLVKMCFNRIFPISYLSFFFLQGRPLIMVKGLMIDLKY
jgi:hypothetical protein